MCTANWKTSRSCDCLAGVLSRAQLFEGDGAREALVMQLPASLGLDLRGGAHLLLAMDTKEWRRTGWDPRDDARKQLRPPPPEATRVQVGRDWPDGRQGGSPSRGCRKAIAELKN